MKKLKLHEKNLKEALTGMMTGSGGLFVTMSTGQWSALLDEAYRRGATLIELDDDERPVKAYQLRKN